MNYKTLGNQVYIVGRVSEINPIKANKMIIKVNAQETEEKVNPIKVQLNGNIATEVNKYVEANELIGVIGLLGKNNIVIATKVSFLASGNRFNHE